MMCALYVLWLAKSTSWDKASSNSEEIKPIVLSFVKLCLASVSVKLLNRNSIETGFGVDLKTFFGMAVPNYNAAKLSLREIEAGFMVILWLEKPKSTV